MSTETKKPMRRIKRPSPWEQVGIKEEVVEKVSQKRVSSGPWMQDKTTVTNGDVTLEVGSQITGYDANGISDWYVLGAKDGHLLIATKSCPEEVELRGRDGYTNGVEILNNVAKKYTNSIYADGNARSINVEDVNRVTGYNPETAGYGANKLWQYGNEVTYFWDGTKSPYYSTGKGVTGKLGRFFHREFFYPTVEGFNCSQKSTTATKINKEEITTLTSTFYYYKVNQYLDRNSVAYNLLFIGKSYWLGSQYVDCSSDGVGFGLRYVNTDGRVGSYYLASSGGNEHSYYCGVLPVVSLKSEIIVDSDGNITI